MEYEKFLETTEAIRREYMDTVHKLEAEGGSAVNKDLRSAL